MKMTQIEAECEVGKKGTYGQVQQTNALQMLTYQNTSEDWKRLRALKSLGYRVSYSYKMLQEYETGA